MNIPSTCFECGQEMLKQANAKYCDTCMQKRRKESLRKSSKKYRQKLDIVIRGN